MRDADRVEVMSPKREGVGVVVAVKTRVLNVPLFTERLEVLEWEPPTRMRLAHGGFVHGTGEWLPTPGVRGGERGAGVTRGGRVPPRGPGPGVPGAPGH